MKITLVFLQSLFSNFLTLVAAKKPFFAVTSFDNLEAYYLECKRIEFSQKSSENDEKIDNGRENICKAILSSPYFFDVRKAHHIDANEILRHGHTKVKGSSTSGGSSSRYYNATKALETREIPTRSGVFYEITFECSAWDRSFGGIESYFISREYRVRNAVTRFVFANNENKTTVVIAVAEEPAKILAAEFTEEGHTYDEKNFFDERYELRVLEVTSRIICDLTAATKIRLCSLILNAEGYRQKYRMALPTHNGPTEPKCEKRNLNLYSRNPSYNFTRGGYIFDPWMLQCKASTIIRQDEPVYLYITLTSKPDEFFVARKVNSSSDNLAILNRFYAPQLALHFL